VPTSSREAEIQNVVAESRPYLDQSVDNLELLFDEALDATGRSSLPHRGIADRSSWRAGLDLMKKAIAEQEPAATATAVFAAGQAVDWAHSIGLNLTDYNIPIAILVALAVKTTWTQLKSGGDATGSDDTDDQLRELSGGVGTPYRPDQR
jgi:hypothetical protein